MKILLINGSPRQHGNTDILLDKVAEGVRLAGREAETIRLADYSWLRSGCLHGRTANDSGANTAFAH